MLQFLYKMNGGRTDKRIFYMGFKDKEILSILKERHKISFKFIWAEKTLETTLA